MEKTNDKWQHLLEIVTVTYQQPLLSYSKLKHQFNKIVIRRFLSLNFIVFMLQFGGLTITTLSASFYPLWFASGASCGLIFMWGTRILPGIVLGSFFAYLLASADLTLTMIATIIFTLQAWVILKLSYLYVTPTLIFYRLSIFIKFIVLAGVITAMTTFALAYFSFTHFVFLLSPTQLWLQWWLANLDGLLILAFAFIAMDSYFPQLSALKNVKLFYLIGLYGVLIISTIMMLSMENIMPIIGFCLWILVLHLLISHRYKWCGMIFSVLLLSLTCFFWALLQLPFFNLRSELIGVIWVEVFLLMTLVAGGWIFLTLPSRA